jgi:endonuclease/exonuclease/phosphatase family metal-dependent hydrolase
MRIKVLTYNIHRAIGVDRRFRLDRIIKILRHYDADVALLQEVDSGVPRSRRLDLASELAYALNYPNYAVGYNVKLRRGHYGNATLSRFPILIERNIDLTVGSHKHRGCLYTSIQVTLETDRTIPVEFFNLHLGLSFVERIQQIGILGRSDEFGSLDKSRPCLVGGDFNDWRNILSPILTDILHFRCTTNKTSGSLRAIRTYPSFSPQGALDKIYYRGDISMLAVHRCRMGISKVASDHLPIIVDFEL